MAAFGFFGAGDPGATEPTAEMRAGAAQAWQVYAALIAQGFAAEQALFLLGQIMVGAATGGAIANGQAE